MNHEIVNLESLIHHFGLDHLEIFGTFKDTTLFEKLDFDNSHEGSLDEYVIEKHKVPKYKYKITFKKHDHTFFAYYCGIPKSQKQPIATKDYIIAYSTAFRLLEYEEVLGFLEWYIDLQHCRRFDICMDIKAEINHLLENYFLENTTGREYKKSGKIQTRYYGEVMNSRNKRQLIRVYDKIRDIKEKQKYKLFADYFALGDVTRLEIEIRQELAKEISYKDIFNDSRLLGIFKNYFKKYTDIFESLSEPSETLYRDNKKYRYINGKRREIDSEEMQGIFYATGRRNTFIGHARAIYNLGFCPVRVLIGEGYIKPKTERILGSDLIEHIRYMESKLKQEFYMRKQKKKDFQNLLDNSPEYEDNGE